jgi:hypothetical protein
MLRRSIALRPIDTARPSIARLALEVGFAFAAYGVTGLLPREHLLLTALLVVTFALRFAFAPTPVALAAALAMAVVGPLVEAGVIALGGFAYGAGIPWEAVPLGFPYWLIALYLHMGLTAAAAARPVPAVLARVGVLAQLVWIAAEIEVVQVLPTPADVVAGEQVVERLTRCAPGPILSPYAAWLPVQAGRAPSPHLITMWDINHPGGPFRDGVARFGAAARAHHWACVVHGGRQPLGFGVEGSYERSDVLDLSAGAMMPKTGWRVRPATVLVPKE